MLGPMSAAHNAADHDIGVEQAATKIQSGGAQVIDVRQQFEWDAGHIEGSHHIPLEQLPSRADELDRDREVIFLCRSGARSGMATNAFRESGLNGLNLAGGLEAWVGAGKPITPADGEVAGPRPDNT